MLIHCTATVQNIKFLYTSLETERLSVALDHFLQKVGTNIKFCVALSKVQLKIFNVDKTASKWL